MGRDPYCGCGCDVLVDKAIVAAVVLQPLLLQDALVYCATAYLSAVGQEVPRAKRDSP